MNTDSQEGVHDLPSADECMRLCATFIEFTETDKALAMLFLQNNSWDLEVILRRFCLKPHVERRDPEQMSSEPVIDLTSDNEDVAEDEMSVDQQHAHLFRLLSWNIDGLSTKSREFRTPSVVSLIKREKFHVVGLQEVVRESLANLKKQLDGLYDIFHPEDIELRDYFPVICVLKHPGLTVVVNSFRVTPFPGSVMQRILLTLDVVIHPHVLLSTNKNAVLCPPIRVRVWTSHLESCANFAKERKNQLKQAWNAMQAEISPNAGNAAAPTCGIFCGDLNLRDKEIHQLGGLPPGMVDVWETCGARPEAKATWDPRRNPNLSLDNPESSFSATPKRAAYGMRFDRMYLLGGGPGRLKPVDFELRGLERVPGRSHFPSDHWAILGHFDIVPP
ncbi:unnamed protein product [Mesocestoides corti]|uniref:Endonuclease/exonuclease/phosphatase domain-containing protein n=1 Tax=Mesocestoides corti TaxID=53468 RepID=A0A0R3UF73_MESCO|nr:unnamed protein product [Mesocestoides corti]